MTDDPKFRQMRCEYHANGRMKKVTPLAWGDETTSVYDGLGQRVQTNAGGAVTNLVYDAFGRLVAEYGATTASVEGGVTYLASDHQGSTRVMMDNSGVVVGRRDYQPFGEEIPGSVGKRSGDTDYSADLNSKRQYAGMERELSGLNHTSWRSQESRAGRWTSPDPYNVSMRPANPQSFNRYSYMVRPFINPDRRA